jgi:putative serine protease PepD
MKRLISIVPAALTGGAIAAAAVFAFGSRPSSHTSTIVAASPAADSSGTSATGSRREVSSSELTATQVYRQDSTGVVAIRAVTPAGEDSGTGIVLDDSGLILTNNHVVDKATTLAVSPGRSPGVSRSATLVGADPDSDLALIKVDPSGLGLKPLKLADSGTLEVGDPVYAIGNPYGLDETLTMGIVSALGREIAAPDGATIAGAIQTDAALNPGNSGGPLIDVHGEVVGINSQIASAQTSSADGQPGSTGVGFAISSDTAAQVVKAIEAGEGGSSAGAHSAVEPSGAEASSSPYGETRSEAEGGSSSGEGAERGSSGEGIESGSSGEGAIGGAGSEAGASGSGAEAEPSLGR